MKKSLVFLLLAGLLTVSCQNDVATVPSGKDVAVTMSAKLPGGSFTTRATNSAAGGVAPNVDFGVYTLRYIMEIYSADGMTLIQRLDPSNTPSFATRLVPGTYKAAFWADIVPLSAATADYHYNTASLQAVTLNTSSAFTGNDDTRDAYTNCVDITVTSAGLTQSVTLKRPFGKIRVMAKDVMAYMPAAPASAQISYSTSLPDGMNVVTGALLSTVIDPQTTPVYTVSSAIGDDLAGTLQTIAWDYIFAPATGQGVQTFTVSAYDAADNLLATRLLSSVPVQRNMLTTATGNFFTANTNFNIIIDPAFGGQEGVDIQSVTFAKLQQYLDEYLALGIEGPLAIDVTDAAATGAIDIPAYDKTSVPYVNFNFVGGVTGDLSVASTGGYEGDVQLGFTTITGTVLVDLPDGNTYIGGPAAGFYDNFSATDDSNIFWYLGTTADLKKVLGDQTFPLSLKGIFQTADIFDCSSNDTSYEAPANVANQQSLAIGDADGGDNARLAGFVYDGQGHTLSGQGMNAIIQIVANNSTVKNVVITNSWLRSQHLNGGYGNCIALYRATGVTLDGVTVKNSNAGGVILNSSEITLAGSFTSSGNAWGGINLGKLSGGNAPKITIAPGATVNIYETVKIWADFAGADHETLAPNGWYCNQIINGAYPTYPMLTFEPGTGTPVVINL